MVRPGLTKFIRWLPVLLLLSLAIIFWLPRLPVQIANNLAALAMLRDLPVLAAGEGLPRCNQASPGSQASNWINLANRIDPQGLATRLNQARLAWLQGDCAQAERMFAEVLAAAPGDFRAAYWLYWLREARLDPASLGISPQDMAGFAWELGSRAEQAASAEAASAWYELSFRLMPNQSLAYRINNLYLSSDQSDKAIAFLSGMQMRYSDQSPEYWWAGGQIGLWRADWQAAAQSFQHAAQLAGDPYDYLLEQADALRHLGDETGEAKAYRQAILARPQSYYPFIGLGQIERKNGNFRAALEQYLQAERQDPQAFLPQFVIGELYLEHGDFELALPYLEQAARLNPEDPYSQYYLAQVYDHTGAGSLAVEALQAAIRLSSQARPEWIVQLGDWLLDMKDFAGALQAYQQAAEAGSTDPTLVEKLASLRLQHGQP
jgi:predicted Zn-dependent protease